MKYFNNFYCHIKDNLYFVVISKCACTSIKKYILDLNNIKYFDFDSIHELIGFEENKFITLVEHKDKLPSNSIKFAIYRDPVERAISAYKHLKKSKRGYVLNNFNDYINLCKEHLNNEPLLCDEHIRRQVDYYKEDDVDFVIDINNLNNFLKTNYNIDLSFENKSNNIVNITEEQINIIKDLYKDDYKIKNYSNFIK